MTVIDLYAGPGGWDLGARLVGLEPVGIELDGDACATRAAAGLATIRGDVQQWPIRPDLQIAGLIGSPPCPAYSAAGNREAVADIPVLVDALDRDIPELLLPSELDDWENSTMAVSPFLWARRHDPEWVALEQVSAVLPIWEAGCRFLERRGYSTWCGVLNAADYGVPQTRSRAFLIANRNVTVHPPEALHDRDPHPRLFGPEALPWITAWEAMTVAGVQPCDDTAAVSVGFPRRDDLGTSTTGYRDRDMHDAQTLPLLDRPALTITEKARSFEWHVNTGRDWVKGGTRVDAQTLPLLDRPAPTVSAKAGGQWHWTRSRPATTVCGDSRLWPPGHKINAADKARLGIEAAEERYGDRAGTRAVRMTVDQAAVLQGFPVGFPWSGSVTSQFKQCGNAVPPPLAARVLAAAAGIHAFSEDGDTVRPGAANRAPSPDPAGAIQKG